MANDWVLPVRVSEGYSFPAAEAQQYERARRHRDAMMTEPTKWSPYDKLKMRIGIGPNIDWPRNVFVSIAQGPNTTFVFVAGGDKALLLEDDNLLFPSDSLIAQFHLFTGSL